MKHYYSILSTLVVVVISIQFGCQKASSFLDKKVSKDLNEQTVFTDSARTLHFLTGVYQGLNYLVAANASAGVSVSFTAVTDESNQRYPSGGMLENQIISGSFGGTYTSEMKDLWSYLYSKIRAVNIYLRDVKQSPLSAGLKTRTSAEARFLRAYFYFNLMKGWGGVPIIGDTVYTLNSKNLAVRSTFADLVNYIVSELDAVAPQLPLSYSGLNYGRVTRGACLALKAKTLLYAASPLFNGGSIATDDNLKKLTAYPTYDPSRWNAALKALQAVVQLGVYHLVVDNQTKPGAGFYEVFLQRQNPEYILAYMMGPNTVLEEFNLPKSRGYWNSFHRCPTQEMVDAFPMKNGLPINDPNSGYNPDDPYSNRAPRFYYSIIYNGSLYYNKQGHKIKPVWTYKGASKDGILPLSAGGGGHTGYYWRKMMDTLVYYKSGGTTDRCLPVITYSEILLDLAEAANETGNTSLAMQQLFKIRSRAGIEPGVDGRYGLPAAPTKDEARKLIHHERFIELAFEGQRFWDLRRWKAFSLIQNKYMHGMQIAKSGNTYTYKIIQLRKHVGFTDKFYLFSVPRNEVFLNRGILQNPGW